MKRSTAAPDKKLLENTYAEIVMKSANLKMEEITVTGEYIDQCPEDSIYITDRNSRLYLEVRITKTDEQKKIPYRTQFFVEWPSLVNDGEFVSIELNSIEAAGKHFAFCLRMINDLRDAVYNIM